jgi:hypothetical protein
MRRILAAACSAASWPRRSRRAAEPAYVLLKGPR